MNMISPRLTAEAMHTLAGSRNLRYRGTSRPKSTVKEWWECARSHRFEATPAYVSEIPPNGSRTGCVYCHGTSRNRTLHDNGLLGLRLMALGLELVGKWNGSKKINSFRCRCCRHEWDDFGITVINQGRKCRRCYPPKVPKWRGTLRPPPLLLSYHPPS